ncbi:hypothetical protein FRC09_020190, partial [Ceratobasidium sp. 395]
SSDRRLLSNAREGDTPSSCGPRQERAQGCDLENVWVSRHRATTIGSTATEALQLQPSGPRESGMLET